MDFLEIVRHRRSVRAYDRREIGEEALRGVLECARAAPSAGNLQAFEVVAVTDPTRKRLLVDAALGQGFLAEAPVVLAFFANSSRSAQRYGRRGKDLYALQDATIACAYAQLAATEAGLSSCWVGAFEDGAVSAALSAPRDLLPVALLAVGHGAEQPPPTPRRALSDLVTRECFGGSRRA